MPVEIDRAALVEQIEIAFADTLSTKERVQYLNRLPLYSAETLPYEAEEIEAVFRRRVWQTVAFEALDQLRDLDPIAEISDEALTYYLPALLILAVSDPSWLVNQDTLERRIFGAFVNVTDEQAAVVITFIEFMVAFYSYLIHKQEAFDDPALLDIEDIEYRLLMYQDEKRSLSARSSET